MIFRSNTVRKLLTVPTWSLSEILVRPLCYLSKLAKTAFYSFFLSRSTTILKLPSRILDVFAWLSRLLIIHRPSYIQTLFSVKSLVYRQKSGFPLKRTENPRSKSKRFYNNGKQSIEPIFSQILKQILESLENSHTSKKAILRLEVWLFKLSQFLIMIIIILYKR